MLVANESPRKVLLTLWRTNAPTYHNKRTNSETLLLCTWLYLQHIETKTNAIPGHMSHVLPGHDNSTASESSSKGSNSNCPRPGCMELTRHDGKRDGTGYQNILNDWY